MAAIMYIDRFDRWFRVDQGLIFHNNRTINR